MLVSPKLSLNGIGWNTRAKFVILVGFDLSIISRIRLLEVRLSVSFLTWISRLQGAGSC